MSFDFHSNYVWRASFSGEVIFVVFSLVNECNLFLYHKV